MAQTQTSLSSAARKQTRAGRYYDTPDGTYPSVTTVLSVIGKPALINWAGKVERELVMGVSADLYADVSGTPKMSRLAWLTTMEQRLGKQRAHQRLLAKAGEIGSQTHALIEWTLRAKLCQQPGPSPHITDKAQWAFMVFEDWAKSVSLKPILVEQIVWSNKHGFAGTMDLLAEVEGKLTVVDFKTGKAVYPEAHLQNAAYRSALREMGHADPVQGIIVRLPKDEKDPEPQAVLADDESTSFDAFLNAKKLWEWNLSKDEWAKKDEQVKQPEDYAPVLQASIDNGKLKAEVPNVKEWVG